MLEDVMTIMGEPQVTSVETEGATQTESATTTASAGIGSPLSNEAYDVITALQAKLEGLEAYRKYAKDGNPDFWKQLTSADVECVGKLLTELENLVNKGHLRMRAPGDCGHH
jgi:hypothetical protein